MMFLKNHDGAINQIILQRNTLVTSSSDGKITIWDYEVRFLSTLSPPARVVPSETC